MLCGSTLASTRGPNVHCTKDKDHDEKCFASIELQDGALLCLEWYFIDADKRKDVPESKPNSKGVCLDCGKAMKNPDTNLCLDCCRKRWPDSPNCPLPHDSE